MIYRKFCILRCICLILGVYWVQSFQNLTNVGLSFPENTPSFHLCTIPGNECLSVDILSVREVNPLTNGTRIVAKDVSFPTNPNQFLVQDIVETFGNISVNCLRFEATLSNSAVFVVKNCLFNETISYTFGGFNLSALQNFNEQTFIVSNWTFERPENQLEIMLQWNNSDPWTFSDIELDIIHDEQIVSNIPSENTIASLYRVEIGLIDNAINASVQPPLRLDEENIFIPSFSFQQSTRLKIGYSISMKPTEEPSTTANTSSEESSNDSGNDNEEANATAWLVLLVIVSIAFVGTISFVCYRYRSYRSCITRI